MLGGQLPDAPFSPDEMDDSHSSDQMRPRDSIPPTENTLEHPETETSDDQQFAAATISLAAPASEADQHSQADQDPKLSSGHSRHLDTSAEMFISAEATGSDSLQHKETESDCPSTEIVDAETPASFHADAAAAGASKQTQSVQDDGPDNKSDLPLALISHRVEARSDSLPPTEGAHPDTEDPLHRLASQEAILVPGSASQPNQQTQAAPAHAQSSGLGSLSGHSVPGAMLTHLAAAAAAAASVPQLPGGQPQLPGDQPQLPGDQSQLLGDQPQPPGDQPQLSGDQPQLPADQPQLPGDQPQLLDDQPQLPGDQPQLTGDQPQLPNDQPQLSGVQPVVTQSLLVCSVKRAQAPALMPEPEHPGHRLTDNSQHQLQCPQAGSAEAELAEQEAQSPVVLDQSQSQEVPKPCEDASALSPIASALSPITSAVSPIAAPPDDVPSRSVAPLDANSQWEAASSCLIVPDSEDPDNCDQHSHSDTGHTASIQSAEQVTPTAAQPPTEAQRSGVDGIQAQATGTAPSPAVAQASQDKDAECEGSDQQQQQQQEQEQHELVESANAAERMNAPQEAQAALTSQQFQPTAQHLVRQPQLPRQRPAQDVYAQQGPGVHVQLAAEHDNLIEHKELAKHEILAEHGNLAEPEILAEPDILAEPEPTGELESLAEPEPSAEPEILAEPEPSTELESLAEHKVSAEPETSAEPEILGEHDNVAEHETVPEEQALQMNHIIKNTKILALSVGGAKDGGAYSGKGADATLGFPALKLCTCPSVLFATFANFGLGSNNNCSQICICSTVQVATVH